jgi:hypothetical protein
MPQTIEQALAAASFYSDGRSYSFVRLPLTEASAAAAVVAEIGGPFCALLVDKDEVSLLVPADFWDGISGRIPDSTLSAASYRLITIDAELEPDLVGFMAHVSAAIAEANISILPFAAYTRDHLFVPEGSFDAAIAALENLR